MDEIISLKAWSRLEMLHKNLPSGNIKEDYIADYHNILKTLEQETGQSLDEFRIPESQIQRHVRSFSEPSILTITMKRLHIAIHAIANGRFS